MTDTPPMAPAGWYDVPAGGKRFWNGRDWSTDLIGAPSPQAEFAALDPYLPAPSTEVIPVAPTLPFRSPVPQAQPAGWYAGPNGATQWWDGWQWGPFAPTAVLARPAKEVGIAYLFLLLLGGFAAQRFYLGLIGSAILFNVLWWGGWILAVLVVGIPMIIAAGIWWFVDLFLLPSLVRSANARAFASAPPPSPMRR